MSTGVHIGIIPDGNRRWSAQHNASVADLLQKILGLVHNSFQDMRDNPLSNFHQIDAITLYVLSKDNLMKRQDQTLDMIRNGLDLALKHLHSAASFKMFSFQSTTKIQFVGELHLLPEDIQSKCRDIEKKFNSGTFVVTVGIGYDPVHDTKRVLLDDGGRPAQRDIDMVIRTGGEIRSSGFFPMHTLYSEWFFLPKLIPDLTALDINECLDAYFKRSRRFGA